jgi:hypothetical protein
MTKSSKNTRQSVTKALEQMLRVHFALVLLYSLTTWAFQAWKLITPDILELRWQMVITLLGGGVIIWLLSRATTAASTSRILLGLLVGLDIILAAFSVYTERGMSSRGVMLFAIPILISAAFRSQRALYMTTLICIATYVSTAIIYFRVHPSEGYKIELYGTLGFYSGVFLLVGLIASILTTRKQ